MIATAHDKMRMVPVRLSSRGKALLVKKRTAKPHRPKHYRLVKTGELIGMDAIELRMGEMRRYIITMIDEREFGKNYRQAEKVCQEGINTDMSITVKQCTGVDKVVGLMLLQKQ